MGKILGPEDIERLREEMVREREAEKAAQIPIPKRITAAMLISLGAGILGGIGAAIFGAEMLAAFFAIQAFAVFGYGFFIGSLRMNTYQKIKGFAFPLFMAVGASGILLGFGALLLVRREVITEEQYQFIKGVLAKAIFIIGGLLQIVPTVYYRISLKKHCTEPVSAVCAELMTVKLGEVNDDPVYGRVPIWQYYYDGEEHTVEDNIYKTKGELPEVGCTDEILIDPNKPEHILTRFCIPKYGIKPIIAAALIAFAIFVI